MTTFDRFDPFERRITEAIDQIAAARPPAYLDDILRQTGRTSQRPRWTFPERWFNVDTTLARPTIFRRVPVRSLIVLAVLASIVAMAAFYVGSQRQLLPPFGPAANGNLAYAQSGDIYIRDGLTGASQVLVGAPGIDAFPFFSPDGTMLLFSTTSGGQEFLKVANAEGSNVRQLLADPLDSAGATWRPDSRAIAVDTTIDGVHKLLIVPVDGSAITEIDLGELEPMNVVWRPPSGNELLFRALDANGDMDLYTVAADGSALHSYDLPGRSAFGDDFTLSGGSFSPDGRTLAYNAIVPAPGLADRDHFRIGIIKPDGTTVVLPGPDDPMVHEAWPAYSPDGKWILVHRWVLNGDKPVAEGWVAVMPADLSGPTRDVGPRVLGGQDTGGQKIWSPDGSRIIWRAANRLEVFSVDPVSGAYETLPWTSELPDWQRVATP